MIDALRQKLRAAEGRDPMPSTSYIDSQTVKATELGSERLTGRKRHIIVDSPGMLMAAVAPMALVRLDAERFPRLVRIWGKSKYHDHDHDLLWWAGWMKKPYRLPAVHRPDGVKGWVNLPNRWVVERSIGWMGRNRRQNRDYERAVGSSEAWVDLGAIGDMLRPLAPDPGGSSARSRYPKPQTTQTS